MDDGVLIRNRFFLRLFKMFFFLYMKELLLHFKVLCVVFVSIFPQGFFFLNDVDIFINTCMTIC